MEEILRFVARYLWIVTLLIGGQMLFHAYDRGHSEHELERMASILGGALLVAVSVVCVSFRNDER